MDSSVVRVVAEALAKADWTDGECARDWTWAVLPATQRARLLWEQLPAARVAVAAMEAVTRASAA
jgi:hypothetical protein